MALKHKVLNRQQHSFGQVTQAVPGHHAVLRCVLHIADLAPAARALHPPVCCGRLHCVLLQVRAEHRAEHDLFRAILLGQSNTPAGPPSAHKAEAAGSVAAAGGQPRPVHAAQELASSDAAVH
jgi:hypothetical protein